MLKSQELSDPQSCLNKALPNERLFVLLSRDAAAPQTIRWWCNERVTLGLNKDTDDVIVEAMECARHMASERPAIRAMKDKHEKEKLSEIRELLSSITLTQGKTINSVHLESADRDGRNFGGLVLQFTDGTAIYLGCDSWSDDNPEVYMCVNEFIDYHKMFRFGLMTKEEHDRREAKEFEEYNAIRKEQRRKQYEQLKQEFENSNG